MVDSPKIGIKEFGDLLRTARERKGMSRNDLVEATGLSYPYISQLETAYRKPSPAAIQKLADALGISLDEIFAAMTKPSPKHSVRKRSTTPAGCRRGVARAARPEAGHGSARGSGPTPAPASRPSAPPAAAGSAGGAVPSVPTPSVVERIVRLFNEISRRSGSTPWQAFRNGWWSR